MASNSTTKKQYRKAYGLMVQPALPLVPGLKPQKSKPVAVEPKSEPEVTDPEPIPQSFTTCEVLPEETQTVLEKAHTYTVQNDLAGEKEVSRTTDSSPSTPQQPTAAPQELSATAPVENGEVDEEVEVDEGVPDTGDQMENGVVQANTTVPEPAIELPGTETDFRQAVDDGDLPASTESPVEEVEYEQQVSEGPGPVVSDEVTATTTPPYVNGTGLSHSTSSEHDAFTLQHEQIDLGYGGTQATVSAGASSHDYAANGYHQPATTTFAPSGLATVSRSFSALPSLTEHFLLLNSTKEGVDIYIQVNPINAQPFASYAHSLVLFRSLRLRRLVDRQQQASNNYSSNVITLYPARYVMPHAFEAALRFLYSDTVLGKDFFVQPHHGTDYQTVRVHNFDYLLSYWVAGIELGLEPVSICAERLLSQYLDWDLLEISYKYAMELVNSPILSSVKSMTGSDYLVASNSIVRLILQFLANHLDIKNFKLDIISTTNLIPSRLPQLEDGRPRHNPALAAMVFGSMPTSAEMSPSSPQSEILPTASTFKDTVASNILLNIDFENLNAFNNFIQAPTIRDVATTELMAEVVSEREIRRLRALNSRVPNKERMANSAAWEPVGLQESITETNVLTRLRVGFLAPSKGF